MSEGDNAAATKTNVFDKHKDGKTANASGGVEISWSARFVIFILFPLCVGCIGLYTGYLEAARKPDRELNFDTDFVMPFLLALTFVIVVGFQTRGYTKNKIEPLVKWPKVRRKKVVRVMKKGEEEDEDDDKDTTAKKDD